MRIAHRFGAIAFALPGAFVLLGLANAATIRTVDSKTVTGTLTACDGKTLTVEVNGKPTTMPVEDIARITLQDKSTTGSPAASSAASHTASAAGSSSAQPSSDAPARTTIRRPRRLATAPVVIEAATAPANSPAPAPVTAPSTAPMATTAPVASPNWRIAMASDDLLNGTIVSWSDGKLTIRPDVAPQLDVTLPNTALQRLWHGAASQQAKAEAMLPPTPAEDDIAFVSKTSNDPLVAVHGTAEGIEGTDLLFGYDGQQRKIALNRIIGIVFASRAAITRPITKSPYQVFRFTDGEQVSGHWTSLKADDLVIATDAGTPLHFSLAKVSDIQFRNGRVVYLSDLTPVKVEQTPFFDRVVPYRTDVALDGGPLKLSDGPHDKGLAMHSRCVLEYDLGGAFDRFGAKVGFEPGSERGQVVLRVLGDGRVLYESLNAKGTDAPAMVDASINGVSRLKIEVDFGEGEDVGDRVVWADARVIREKGRSE